MPFPDFDEEIEAAAEWAEKKEAQSEAPSVDTILRELVRQAELAGSGNIYASDSLSLYLSDAVAKINRLIIEAELRGFDKAFDSHDYDGLREYRAALSNNLSKGDGK